MAMLYLELCWSFIKIGFTSFGGMSMIPLITSEMLSHGWMTMEELSDIVGIAEMTPGPLGLNCATFTGMRTGGILGALAANIGVLMPAFTMTTLVAVFFERFRKTKAMEHIMIGVRPAGFGLVAGIMFTLAVSNYFAMGNMDLCAIIIGLIDALLLWKKMSVVIVIGISAVMGMVVCGIM